MTPDPMSLPNPAPELAGEFHILIGGSLVEAVGEVVAMVAERYLGYSRVNVQTIEALPAFLKAAAQSPPDLFLLHLFFSERVLLFLFVELWCLVVYNRQDIETK